MVDLDNIPDFAGSPGQTPTPGTGPDTLPVAVVLVTSPLDADGLYTPINQAAVDTFITGEVVAARAYSTSVARWSPWSSLQLRLTLGAARGYNYARFTLPDGSKWYGYLSADYLNVTDTLFTIIADDCTTYPYTVGYSTWKFGHVAVAASQSDTYGNQYCDAPEPVDVTPEYGELLADLTNSDMADMKAIVISTNGLQHTPFIVTSSQGQITDGWNIQTPGDANIIINDIDVVAGAGPSKPLIWWESSGVFHVPITETAPTSTIDGVPQGGGAYVFTMGGLQRYMDIMQSAPWMLQGIAEIRFVPAWAVDGGADYAGPSNVGEITNPVDALWANALSLAVTAFEQTIVTNTKAETLLAGWRETVLANYGANIYRKLITSAGGTSIVLSNGDSTQEFTPEAWLQSGLSVEQVPHGTYGGIQIIPTGYGGLIGGEMGLTLQFSGSTTPAQGGTALAHQHGQGSKQGSTWGYRRAFEMSLFTADLVNLRGLTVAGFQAALNTANGAIGGAMGVGASGGTTGGAIPLVSGITSVLTSNASLALAEMSIENATELSYNQVKESLRQYLPQSTWSVGDDTYAVSSQGGGANVNGAWQMLASRGGRLIIKVPTKAKIRTLLSQWDRKGYAIDRAFVPPRLDPMDHRSYWQGEDVIVLGGVPADAKSRIAARFERGTTVVTAVAEIGQQTANTPRTGVSY